MVCDVFIFEFVLVVYAWLQVSKASEIKGYAVIPDHACSYSFSCLAFSKDCFLFARIDVLSKQTNKTTSNKMKFDHAET